MHQNTEESQDQQPADQENSTGRYMQTDEKKPITEASPPTEQQQTTNPKPATDNMEVHHHTHHPKNWKEYFWEFFMLFLAVFCGSLAELQLEHYIEHQREKRFVKQLANDLKADATNLAYFLEVQDKRRLRIDSLLSIFANDEQSTKGDETYFHTRRIIRPGEYLPSDGTITQLKFGANLRLIRPIGLADSIISYDRQSRQLVEILDLINETNFRFTERLRPLFDAKVFNAMLGTNNEINQPIGNPQLITKDKILLNEFFMELQFTKGRNARSIIAAKALLARNHRLYELLTLNYKFLDEL